MSKEQVALKLLELWLSREIRDYSEGYILKQYKYFLNNLEVENDTNK